MICRIYRIIPVVALLSIVLSGCVQPIVLVGERREAIDPEMVKIYYARRPACEFETVGYLRVNGGYYSQASLLRAMQQQAADVGADGVFVHETHRLDIPEYIGVASAIRCLS